MALTLNETLLAAQSSQSRHPICDLIVRRSVDDLPFPKNPGVIPVSGTQRYPKMLVMPDGRIALIHNVDYNGGNAGIGIAFSDADRTAFGNRVIPALDYTYSSHGLMLDAVVLNASGDIGIVVFNDPNWSKGLYAHVVNSSGVKISSSTIWNTAEAIQCISVVKRADNDFVLVYRRADNSLVMITSTNFTSWSAESAVTVGGLTAGSIIRDVKVTKLTDGSYMMFLSYQAYIDDTGSIYNIYYSTSTDMITWVDVLPLTDTTLKSRDYYFPDVVQKSDGSLFIAMHEYNSYLSMTKDTTGWVVGVASGQTLTVSDQWLDSANGKLYVMSYSGGFKGGAKIDLATWTIDKCYSGLNVPAIPAYFMNGTNIFPGRQHGALGLMPIVKWSGVCLLDFDNDNHRSFFFTDETSGYGAGHEKNVNWTPYTVGGTTVIKGAWVDTVNNRLYVHMPNTYIYHSAYQFGYIDLDQTGPTYDFTTLATVNINHGNDQWATNFRVYPDESMLLIWGASATWGGSLHVIDINNNAIYKSYYKSSFLNFPAGGVMDAHLVGNTIFCTPVGSNSVGETYKYHILEINLVNDNMMYHISPYDLPRENLFGSSSPPGSVPYYGAMRKCEATKEFIIAAYKNPVVFNYENYSWEYVDYNVDGSAPTPVDNNWYVLDYDPVNDVYLGAKGSGILYLLPRSGDATRLKYVTGTKTTDWTFGAPETLVSGYKNVAGRLAVTEDDAVWATWTDNAATAFPVSWGKTGAQLSLQKYLTDETEFEWSLEGAPSSLHFKLSHGHLFDPQNSASILNYYLSKGSSVTAKLGELVGGVEYWANQGVYIIRELALRYQRGEYPVLDVSCEDITCLWEMAQIAATQLTTSYPDDGIKAIVKANTPLTDDDFNLPTFTDRFTFDAMWIDTYLSDIVHDLANRFKYFIIMNMDGKVEARRIDTTKAVSNAYTDKSKLIDFTPNDAFSDLTNRFIVTGQSLDDIEVLYNEERVGTLSGTVGWWGGRKDFVVPYSEDMRKTAKYPRLVIVESVQSMGFALADMTDFLTGFDFTLGNNDMMESITHVDTENKYCTVTIDSPNLTNALVAHVGALVALSLVPDEVLTFGVGATGGITIRYGTLLCTLETMTISAILSAVGNYQLEIWARPIGYVKRDYSATADDTALQQQLGMIIPQKEEGFLCFTPAHCQYVADFERDLAVLQRNRVTAGKIAHLKDEVGDVISVPHPYTDNTIKMLITKLNRKYKPSTLNGGEGYFTDTIDGWVI
ncbi:MAG: hypothetical protein EHM79_02175 [Geobacter sp.]|nr:MAG: hypothetical protein EHM79_02175 [Geobacter sp.]